MAPVNFGSFFSSASLHLRPGLVNATQAYESDGDVETSVPIWVDTTA